MARFICQEFIGPMQEKSRLSKTRLREPTRFQTALKIIHARLGSWQTIWLNMQEIAMKMVLLTALTMHWYTCWADLVARRLHSTPSATEGIFWGDSTTADFTELKCFSRFAEASQIYKHQNKNVLETWTGSNKATFSMPLRLFCSCIDWKL